MVDNKKLLQEIESAESKLLMNGRYGCKICVFLNTTEDEELKTIINQAVNSNIGINKLSEIFINQNIPLGRKSIERHRKEEKK